MKNKKIFLLLLLVPIIIFFIGRTFALPYREEIRSVEIQSSNYPNPGSWHIDKSAKWIDTNKARITFDVDSIMKRDEGRCKDVILVIDISGSMEGEKLDRAKQDAIELTNYLLSDSCNRMALITFSTDSSIERYFTNNKEQMLNYLNSLEATFDTNYKSALQNVELLMENYVSKEDTDIVTLFLTDGYPNVETPNEVATYHILKERYPYMTINGIQYEMGVDIIQEIINISDNQWVANKESLHNVLFDAALSPLSYSAFVITDYINDEYFYVNSIDDVKVDKGEVSLELENGVQKIIWNLDDNYQTSDNIKMTIDLELKEEYHDTKGLYPTNRSETIKSKLLDEEEKTVNIELTPVLKNSYYVIYDKNTPNSCNLPSIPVEEHFAYQDVNKIEKLECEGYEFKGWLIDDDDKKDMTIVNDDLFVMPSHDVHIKAIWSNVNLLKKTEGTVHIKQSIYNVLENEANDGLYARKYNGEHDDSFTTNGTYDIYHWYADSYDSSKDILDRNNVIFANQCWQMIRTTDTGGVKLIYNGEPENNQCLNTRSSHEGYQGRTTTNLEGNYYYGTSYVYDKVNKNFKLSGTLSTANITYSYSTGGNASTIIPTLRGLYTCRQTSPDATCSTLYLIDGYSDYAYAYALQLVNWAQYSQYGNLQYNKSYGSPSYAGYMYNNVYTTPYMRYYTDESMLSRYQIDTSYWYGNSLTSSYYARLNSPYQITSSSQYPSLVGKYTLMSTSSTLSSRTPCYIAKVDGNYMYCMYLTDGKRMPAANTKYTYGDSYVVNENGTFTITNSDGSAPQLFYKSQWADVYSTVIGNYMCKDATNNTCSQLFYISSAMSYMSMTINDCSHIYKFASGFRYDEDSNTYILNDDSMGIVNLGDSNNREYVKTHHYTCWNESGVCETISYVYTPVMYYHVDITGGKDINDVINEMLFLDNNDYHINSVDSEIKYGIEAWYKKYIYDEFDSYIEDTIYCNDRSITDYGGWSTEPSETTELRFNNHDLYKTDLTCPNETDKFSTQNNKAKLTYKVGLATAPEMNLLNYTTVRVTGQHYWLMTPYFYTSGNLVIRYLNAWGTVDRETPDCTYGVRPVISLKHNVSYIDGDGSMEHPYRVDDGANQ